MSTLFMEAHGAALHPGAAFSLVGPIEAIVTDLPGDRAGLRLHGIPALTEIHADKAIRRIVGPAARPVRAILFDKSPTANWSLGWHQDRTIAMRDRYAVPGYGPWSIKAGIHHVEPPFSVIAAMTTLRIHLDPVDRDTAPLLIAPGSHRLGKVAAGDAAGVAERIGPVACLADRGDIWAYATPILHASDRNTGSRGRRVLQVDFSALDLPPPLAWFGV